MSKNFPIKNEHLEVIDRKRLERDLSLGIANKVVRDLKSFSTKLVPDYDNLSIGDVLLSRPKAVELSDENENLFSVARHQKKIPRFSTGESWTWTHAMIYVGRLHVVESQKNIRSIPGVGVAPLTKHKTEELMICRRKAEKEEVDTRSYLRGAALYALMDQAVNRRFYDVKRIAAIASDGQGKLRQLTSRLFPPDFRHAVICSEFVLECLAIGGTLLAEEWASLTTDDAFFYPADFYLHSSFDKIPVNYLQLV